MFLDGNKTALTACILHLLLFPSKNSSAIHFLLVKNSPLFAEIVFPPINPFLSV